MEIGQWIKMDVDVNLRALYQSKPPSCLESFVGLSVVCRGKSDIGSKQRKVVSRILLHPHSNRLLTVWIEGATLALWKIRKFLILLKVSCEQSVPPVRWRTQGQGFSDSLYIIGATIRPQRYDTPFLSLVIIRCSKDDCILPSGFWSTCRYSVCFHMHYCN